MTDEPPSKRKCLGVDCDNDAGSLQCPTCLKLGIKDSFFCSQDCFKKSWVSSSLGREATDALPLSPTSATSSGRVVREVGDSRQYSWLTQSLCPGHPQVNA